MFGDIGPVVLTDIPTDDERRWDFFLLKWTHRDHTFHVVIFSENSSLAAITHCHVLCANVKLPSLHQLESFAKWSLCCVGSTRSTSPFLSPLYISLSLVSLFLSLSRFLYSISLYLSPAHVRVCANLLFSQIGTLFNLSFLLTVHSTVHVFAAVGCWNGLACTAVELASIAYAFQHLPVLLTDSDNRDEVRFLFVIVACGGDIQPLHLDPLVGRHFNQSRPPIFFVFLELDFTQWLHVLLHDRQKTDSAHLPGFWFWLRLSPWQHG